MSQLKYTLNRMALYFFAITTFLVLLESGRAWIFGSDAAMYVRELIILPAFAFLSVLPLLIMALPMEIKTRKHANILNFVHYVLTGIFVIVPQVLWLSYRGRDVGIGDIPRIFITYTAIYSAIFAYSYFSQLKTAKELNKQLEELHKE
ncbi:MAG: hypothetical protein FWB80_08285 [Defluviitaleaceae bacterium]|nr:hypothetical protein [Defluviitaleaceae bacterium]